MTTMASNRTRGCTPTKWQTMPCDNRRKSSSNTADILERCEDSKDARPNSARYSSPGYRQDCASEHDIQFRDDRNSQESIIDEEEPNLEKNTSHDYPDGRGHVKFVPRQNEGILRQKYQRVEDYPEVNVSDAIIAMQKIQKLKELHRKRDLSERYYSQEIRRLIGEHYFGPRVALSPFKMNEKLQNSTLQPYSGDRPRNNLEPCGTMTTITRLDCGCVQETTRPIFTTTRGRVLKKSCSQSQDDVLLKLASSNLHEHLFSSLDTQKGRQCIKSKKNLSFGPRLYSQPSDIDQDREIGRCKNGQQSEGTGHTSRKSSPRRKVSDTSASSI